jgi:predicted SprT family Zn-dependent metalloprotease
VSELARVQVWAEALIKAHLDPAVWTFGFDRAKRRAGLCDFTAKRITLSRALTELAEDDDVHQVLLHEVAHALAGPFAGHGPIWKIIARDLGYVGGRTHEDTASQHLAPWLGDCPAGHSHARYRRPTRPQSCGKCAKHFTPEHLINWRQRDLFA